MNYQMSVFLVVTVLVCYIQTQTSSSQNAKTSMPGIGVDVQQKTHIHHAMNSSEFFWNTSIENLVHKKLFHFSRIPVNLQFVDVRSGCGRLKNRLLIADNGAWYCARYRDNIEQLQGEMNSYLLAKLLEIPHVPTASLMEVTPFSSSWIQVWSRLKQSGWKPGEFVVITAWIDGLQPVSIPNYLLTNEDDQTSSFIYKSNISNSNQAELLVQWTDMIAFDFLTGNLDRFISHLYSLETSDKNALLYPVHNLKQTAEGFLVFLDNESGFGHSYRRMRQYQHLHHKALKSICILRKSTFERLSYLHHLSALELMDQFNYNLNSKLFLPLSESHIKTLKERIELVYKHFEESCKTSKR